MPALVGVGGGRSLPEELDGRSRDRGGRFRGGLAGLAASEDGDSRADVATAGLMGREADRENDGGKGVALGGASSCSRRCEKSRLLSLRSFLLCNRVTSRQSCTVCGATSLPWTCFLNISA